MQRRIRNIHDSNNDKQAFSCAKDFIHELSHSRYLGVFFEELQLAHLDSHLSMTISSNTMCATCLSSSSSV